MSKLLIATITMVAGLSVIATLDWYFVRRPKEGQ